MSVWRRKAIECLPELRAEFQKPGTSIYGVFVEVFAAAKEAHTVNDVPTLQRIYSFAEWCFRSKEEELWNAAGVSFYEHLVDYEETLAEMPVWVKKDIYDEISVLLKERMPEQALAALGKRFGSQ